MKTCGLGDPLDEGHGVQLDAAPRPPDLQMIEVEETDSAHPHDCAHEAARIATGVTDQGLDHSTTRRNALAVRRQRVLAEVRVAGLDDQVAGWMQQVGKHDVHVVIRLTLDARDATGELVHVKFFGANTSIGVGAAA